MKFYTFVEAHRGRLYVRGYDDGLSYKYHKKLKPFNFIPVQEKTPFKTLTGKHVERIDFDSSYEQRQFLDQYKDVDGFDIYGLTGNLSGYAALNEMFPRQVEFDPRSIRVLNYDLEVDSEEDGFPDPLLAEKPINAITFSFRQHGIRRYVSFGFGGYKREASDISYYKCKDEAELLRKAIALWRKINPDIITGWFIDGFDNTYFYRRTIKVLGPEAANSLSPFDIVKEREYTLFGNKKCDTTFFGIASLDYLELYKKFSFKNHPSFKLDYISHVELGEKKNDYSDVGSLHKLARLDHQRFISYNIKDVRLVDWLDDKLDMISQVIAIAYDAKVNFADASTTVRLWDVYIHNHLISAGIVVPQRPNNSYTRTIVGGYVKPPHVGMHNYVVSFDLTSLYPMLIIMYNISPETFVDQIGRFAMESNPSNCADTMLDGYAKKVYDKLKSNNVALASNGALFNREKRGFLPQLMLKVFEDRAMWKKKLFEVETKLAADPDNKELKALRSQCFNMQLAKKIEMNSCYGALANEYFRWFDPVLAEAITVSGQYSIRYIARAINEFLNKECKTHDVDYVIAIDTDSVYINMEKLVRQNEKENVDKNLEFLDEFCESKLVPHINKSYSVLADEVNAYENKMNMDREIIADRAIWTAKKRYAANVRMTEGVDGLLPKPKVKMMGIEAVKSSTPDSIREAMTEAIEIALRGNNDEFIDFVEHLRETFSDLSFEDVAFPRGVNDLDKYSGQVAGEIYSKGCPIHVRGSLLYNKLLKDKKLDKIYPKINNGDKIKFCYLTLPNPINENVIAVPDVLPREFALEKYIDYDTQFEKAFIKPITAITDAIEWQYEKISTLDDFF